MKLVAGAPQGHPIVLRAKRRPIRRDDLDDRLCFFIARGSAALESRDYSLYYKWNGLKSASKCDFLFVYKYSQTTSDKRWEFLQLGVLAACASNVPRFAFKLKSLNFRPSAAACLCLWLAINVCYAYSNIAEFAASLGGIYIGGVQYSNYARSTRFASGFHCGKRLNEHNHRNRKPLWIASNVVYGGASQMAGLTSIQKRI